MSRYLHVLHSYARRPRFWIFAACYLAFSCVDSPQAQQPVICVSVLFASVVTGLIALHLRRQFATPQAHLMPDFFLPHFAVAVLLSGLVWIAVPWWEAAHMQLAPRVVISAHALAALLMAAVVLWSKAIVAIPALPPLVAWLVMPRQRGETFPVRFMAGEAWGAYWALIGAAVVGYLLIAWRLRRLSDINVATSDDFSLEQPGNELAKNPVVERLLGWRDAAIERRLASVAGGRRSLSLRRIPSAVSWQEMAIFPILTLTLLPLGWYVVGDPAGGWLVVLAGVGLMLFAPFSSWRFRLNALSMEFVRPATRARFFRDILFAMALDFCAWTAAASATVLCAWLLVRGQDGFDRPLMLLAHIVWLWGMAVLLFGIGVASLRFRAWMPLFIGLLIASISVAALPAMMIEAWYPRHFTWPYVLFGSFAVVWATIGLGLSWATYRHWLQMDLA
jgi:hypothetical protein